MGRSQRHLVVNRNASTRGYVFDEGGLAPAALKQAGGPYTVPVHPAGGPLSGSPMMGAFPIGFAQPIPHEGEGGIPQLPARGSGIPTGEREFPLGPYSFLRLEPATEGGVRYVLEPGADIRQGDTVRIEATGTSAANGDYVVMAVKTVNGELAFVAPAEAAGEIIGRGRVTVLSGG